MSNYYDNIDELEGFQRTIRVLARNRFNKATLSDKKTPGPREIAVELYKNYFEYVSPRGASEKHTETREKNIASITRQVQKHYNYTEPYKVPSHYMYAYSLLFNCSLDYLYGKTAFITPSVEASKICETTGLSPVALENILSGDEAYIRNYCDMLPDIYMPGEDFMPALHFWNQLLESECYSKLPELYYSVAESFYLLKQTKVLYKELEKKYKKFPSKKKFIELLQEYNDYVDYDFDEYCKLNFKHSIIDIYDKDKYHSKEIIKDIYDELYYENQKHERDIENAYSVSLFKLNNYFIEYFKKIADKYEPITEPEEE